MSKNPISETANRTISRRGFTFALAGFAFMPLGYAQTVSPEQAKGIYRRSIIIDCLGGLAGGDGFSASHRHLNYPRRLEVVAVGLAKRGHSSAVIKKVIGGNFYRAFREIWS